MGAIETVIPGVVDVECTQANVGVVDFDTGAITRAKNTARRSDARKKLFPGLSIVKTTSRGVNHVKNRLLNLVIVLSMCVHIHDVIAVEIHFLVVNVMRMGVSSHVGGVVNVAIMVAIVLPTIAPTVGCIVVTARMISCEATRVKE